MKSRKAAFDANGNELVFQRRDYSQIVSTYDALNRRLTKAPANQPTIAYGYDYSGRLLTAQADGDSAATQVSYDTAGRKTGEYSPVFGSTTATLDAAGNTTSLVYPPSVGATEAFTYDALNRLTGVYDGSASSGVRVAGYGYDVVGRRTSVSYGPASAAVATTSLSYTAASQVSNLSHSWSGAALGLTYGYNADHQRTGVSATDAAFLPSGLAAVSTGYTANALNHYSAVSGTSYSYDKRGNLLSDGVWSYEETLGLSYHHLVKLAQWHINEDNYASGRAAIVDAHPRHPLTAMWGDGTDSSSDGRYFRAGGDRGRDAHF